MFRSSAAPVPRWNQRKLLVYTMVGMTALAGLLAGIIVALTGPDTPSSSKGGGSGSGAETQSLADADIIGINNAYSDVPIKPVKTYTDPPSSSPAGSSGKKPGAAAAAAGAVASAGTLLSKIAGISSSSSGDAGAGGNALGGVTLPSSSKLASFLDKLGVQDQMHTVTESAKQAWDDGSFTGCVAADGPGLVRAINTQKCTYVTLAANQTYSLGGQVLEITQPTVVVGNPAFLPLIDAGKSARAFHVQSGGYLQLSFVTIYRGAETKIGTTYVYTRGGSLLIDEGGGALVVGVVFSQPTPTTPDFKLAPTIGGHILQMGGELFLNACHFIMILPVGVRMPAFFGGDILLVGGILTEVACTHTQAANTIIGGGSGLFIHILGGVGIFTGCAFTRAIGANSAAGAGIHVAIAAGVGIFTGCTMITNGGLFAFFGAGVHQFLGAGVLINTGVTTQLNLGLGFGTGVGPLKTIGAGIFVATGTVFSVNCAGQFVAFSGAMGFLGPGSSQITGSVFIRTFGMVSAWGLGGQLGIEGGTSQIIGVTSSFNGGLVGSWLLGHQFWLAAGQLTHVLSPSSRLFGIRYRDGQATNSWVGTGSLNVILSPDSAEGDGWSPPDQTRFWIMGTGSKTGDFGSFTPTIRRRLDGEEIVLLGGEEGSDEPIEEVVGQAGQEPPTQMVEPSQQEGEDPPTIFPAFLFAAASVLANRTGGASGPFVTASAGSTTMAGGALATPSPTPAFNRSGNSFLDFVRSVIASMAQPASSVLLMDLALSDTENGRLLCRPPLGTGDGVVSSCFYKNVTQDGCPSDVPLLDPDSANTCMRNPYLPNPWVTQRASATTMAKRAPTDAPTAQPSAPAEEPEDEEAGPAEAAVNQTEASSSEEEDSETTVTMGEETVATDEEEEEATTTSSDLGARARRKLATLQNGDHATYVLRSDVLLACQSYKTCPNTAAVKSALVSYLKPVMPSIRISVAPTSLEPLVVDLYSDDSQVNYSGLDTCPHVATFQVFVVTDDLQTYKDAEALLQALNDDPANDDITLVLRQSSPGLCVVAADVTFSYAVPSLPAPVPANPLPSLQDWSLAFAPAVTVKNATSDQVLVSVVAGSWYTIELSRFTPGSRVELRVRSGDHLEAEPISLGSFAISSLMGPQQVVWRAPAVEGDGRSSSTIYIEATDIALKPGMIVLSELIDVVSPPSS